MCLYGTNENKINSSEDGSSVVLTVETPSYFNLDTPANVREYLKENMLNNDSVNLNWVDQLRTERGIGVDSECFKSMDRDDY
jgi:hypothetical protein